MRASLKIPALLCAVAVSGAAGFMEAAAEPMRRQQVLAEEPGAKQRGELILKRSAGESNYCHMKFPAIDERTLASREPVLKPQSSGDIIDFYGPCNYDPTGDLAVQDQKLEKFHSWSREYAS